MVVVLVVVVIVKCAYQIDQLNNAEEIIHDMFNICECLA